ncbi:MAG: M56 family metallopeptidase [Bacteroides sp.]
MNPELVYFLKMNAGIVLLYAFYRLFFYRDTFFRWRRIALLSFIVLSLVYPLMNLQEWVKEQEPMVAMADIYASVILPELTIDTSQTVDWKIVILHSLTFFYWSGVALFFLRFLVQLFSILRLRIQCRAEEVQGTRIYRLKQKAGPFSFFQWIFVHPSSHTGKELEEILTHELTHVRQHHSVDVVFSELMCIACWFNPFAWLMKREVRSNLEYMADHRVLETGHDYRTYQFHLLGLAHQKAAANLSNSFNVLPLKNRIKMMNKKRTKEIGRAKYLMFLPLAILLIVISNIETVARTTKNIAKEMIQTMTPAPLIQTPPQDKKKAVAKKVVKADDSPLFEVVEQMPEFPGGIPAMMEFITTTLRYPATAHANGTQGRVIIQFVVEKDGTVNEAKAIKKVSSELDTEAIRIVSSMPKWTPAKQKGQAVRVKYTIPISFRLSGPTPAKVKENALEEVTVVPYNSVHNTNAAPEEPIFQVVEQMPQFPGGINELMSFFGKNIKYPVDAQKNGKEGRVIASMVIDKQGNVTQAKILKGIYPSLDAEALRLIYSMPKWEPGKQRGVNVNVKYTIPISFKLNKPLNTPTKVN